MTNRAKIEMPDLQQNPCNRNLIKNVNKITSANHVYIYMVGRAGSIPFPLYSILLALNSLLKINSLNEQTWIFNSALDQTKLSKVPMEIGHGHLCFEIVNTVPYRKKLNTCVNFILYLS